MSYVRQWRWNVAAVCVLALFAGLVAISGSMAHRLLVGVATADRHAKPFVTLVVTGSAPGGISATQEISCSEGCPSRIVARHATLPFRTRVSTASNLPVYAFRVKVRGAGRIRCTIRIGRVTEVREAFGKHATCRPAVGFGWRKGQTGNSWGPD